MSTRFVTGNPLREGRGMDLMPSGHLRVFTPLALKRLVEMHGFSVEMVKGYPPNEDFGLIFNAVEMFFRGSKFASFIALKAKKIKNK